MMHATYFLPGLHAMNIQTKTNKDEDNVLVYNHDEARVLVTVITTFNEHMEHIVEEEHGQQHIASRQASLNLVIEPRPQLIKK